MATFNLGFGADATGGSDDDTFNFNNGGSVANPSIGIGADGKDKFNIGNGAGTDNNIVAEGNEGDDTFLVSDSASLNITIKGGAGADIVTIQSQVNGLTNSSYDGGDGFDWIISQHGFGTNWDFSGSTASDANGSMKEPGFVDLGLTSVEAIVGSNTASDNYIGGAFDMLFVGRGGNDSAVGGAGNEVFVGGNDSDNLSGGDGDDVLLGGGWNANGTFVGGGGSNTLDGGNGNDVLQAGNGGDVLIVGDGEVDVATLNLGKDEVICDGTSDLVIITRFTAANTAAPGNDRDILTLTSATGIDTFDELLAKSVQRSDAGVFGTLIITDNGGYIYLDGVNKTSLTATDFQFVI